MRRRRENWHTRPEQTSYEKHHLICNNVLLFVFLCRLGGWRRFGTLPTPDWIEVSASFSPVEWISNRPVNCMSQFSSHFFLFEFFLWALLMSSIMSLPFFYCLFFSCRPILNLKYWSLAAYKEPRLCSYFRGVITWFVKWTWPMARWESIDRFCVQ